MAGSDYTSVSSEEVFTSGSPGGASRCIDIGLLDDSPSEEELNFTLTLTTSDPDVMLGNDVTAIIVTIGNVCIIRRCSEDFAARVRKHNSGVCMCRSQ